MEFFNIFPGCPEGFILAYPSLVSYQDTKTDAMAHPEKL
jgi:hypothetical protein